MDPTLRAADRTSGRSGRLFSETERNGIDILYKNGIKRTAYCYHKEFMVYAVTHILEALNTDLVCDAINTAMRELFLQIVYGRSQSAFSEDGLVVGAGLEDLGKGLRSQVGTMYGTLKKGPRYLEMAEGYVTGIALDAEDQIIGYQFVSLGKMTDFIKKGDDPNTAWEKAKGQYGRVADAVKIIDPRKE